MHHQVVGQVRVRLRVVRKLLQVTVILIESRKHVLIKVLTLLLELYFGQMTEVVVSFSHELFGVQECVNQETATTDSSGNPVAANTVLFTSGHLRSLQSSNSRPVWNPQHRDPGKQNLNGWTAQIMRNDKIWINLVQTMNECLEHLLLIIEDTQSLVVFHFLLSVERQGDWVKFAEHREVLEFLFLGGTVLIDLWLYDTWNQCDLSCVLLAAGHFTWKSKTDEGWWWLVQIVEGARRIFWVINPDFVSGPSASLIHLDDAWSVCNREPAWTSDLALEDKQFKHRLLGTKHSFESVTSQITWKLGHGGWILYFQESVFSVGQWHLEAVLACDTLALPPSDLLEPTLSQLFKFGEHIHQQLVFLFLR